MDASGKIITFYSYKGGVGRSMALANVGLLLARWGYKTIMIDLDLEAPGLNFFFLDQAPMDVRDAIAEPKRGVLDLLVATFDGDLDAVRNGLRQFPVALSLPHVRSQTLFLLSAGRRDQDYFSAVRALDARSAYTERNAGAAVESLRELLKDAYDVVLIDSRTGNTEIGGINTVQLPDLIAAMFTPTEQAFLGVIDILHRAESARQRLPFPRARVPILPVPSRIEVSAEYRLSQTWFKRISKEFEAIVAPWMPLGINAQRFYENVKLPQISFFGYGERLPIIEQGTSDPAGLGYAYENIAALLALDLTDVVQFLDDRDRYISRAAQGQRANIVPSSEIPHVYLSYSHSDQKWAERLRVFLKPFEQADRVVVEDASRIPMGSEWTNTINAQIERADIAVVLVSADYLASESALSVELPALVDRGIRLLWIAVGPSLWEDTPLANFQAVNDPSRPLSNLLAPEQDQVFVAAGQAIGEMVGRRGF
jgi:cellulose biosynthesis protein BcsQ